MQDLTNKNLGCFTAIAPTIHRDSSRHVIWLVTCNNCGKAHYASSSNLLRGRLPVCDHKQLPLPYLAPNRSLNLAIGSCGIAKFRTATQSPKKQNKNNQIYHYFYRIQIIGSYYDFKSHHFFIIQPLESLGKFSKNHSPLTPCKGAPELGKYYAVPAKYLYHNFSQEKEPFSQAVIAKRIQFADSNPDRNELIARRRFGALKRLNKISSLPQKELSEMRHSCAKYLTKPPKTEIMFERASEIIIF